MAQPRSPLLPIFLTVLVDVLGLTLMLPLLPYYAQHFGASAFTGNLLYATFAGCQLLSGPILGNLSDRFGRKPVLIASQMGTFVGLLILGSAGSLWMLFAGRIIDGLTAGNLSIAQAYISDVTTPKNRTRSFALIGISFGVGFVIGPALSGVLADRFGYAAPAWAAAAMSFTSIVLSATMLPGGAELARIKAEKQREADAEAGLDATAPVPSPADEGASVASKGRWFALAAFFRRPAPRLALLRFFAFTLAFQTLTTGLAPYLKKQYGFSVKQTGLVFLASGIVGVVVQGGLIRRLVAKLGESRLSLIGFLSLALGTAFLGWVHTVPPLLVLVVLGGFGGAVIRPSLTTLLTHSVDRNEQGGVLGVSQSLQSVSTIVGSPLAGILIERYAPGYGLAASAFALAGVWFMLQGGSELRAAEAKRPA